MTPVEVENTVSTLTARTEDTIDEDYGDNLAVECYCIKYLRNVLGINIRGDAKDIKPNVDRPYVGGVVLQKYGNVYHASLISGILINGNLLLKEANFVSCKATDGRVLDINSPNIIGYWFVNPNSIK